MSRFDNDSGPYQSTDRKHQVNHQTGRHLGNGRPVTSPQIRLQPSVKQGAAMSEQVDHDAMTAAGPTELGAAIPETGPQLAYSEETEVLDYPEPVSRLRVALIAVGIMAVAAIAVSAVLVVGRTRQEAPAASVAAPTTSTSATPQPLGASSAPTTASTPVTVTTVIVQSTVAQKKPPPPPQAARVQSTWTYELQWGGAPGISVIEHAGGVTRTRYVVGGYTGIGTGWTGEVVGVDPILEEPLTWATCTLYVDGRMAKTSAAVRGDGHDVSCLVRLTR